MSLGHIRFLSGWIPPDQGSMVMTGRKTTLEIENNGGDFLILVKWRHPILFLSREKVKK
jgi:hypothetical protein